MLWVFPLTRERMELRQVKLASRGDEGTGGSFIVTLASREPEAETI